MCLYVLSLSLSMTNVRHKNYLQNCVEAAASTSRGLGKVRRLESGGNDLHYWCIKIKDVRGMGGGCQGKEKHCWFIYQLHTHVKRLSKSLSNQEKAFRRARG